jgi:hypothetical protein
MTNAEFDDRYQRLVEMTENNTRSIAELRQLTESNSRALAETRLLTESNAKAIAANSNAIATSREEMRANITDVIRMITTSAEQAEIDRAEFRATVRQLLEVLTQRFTSNGH